MTQKLTTKIADCYKQNDSVRTTIITIYRDNVNGNYQIHTIRRGMIDSLSFRSTEESALRLATTLGYVDVVRVGEGT